MLKRPLLIHGWGFSSGIFRNFRGIKYDLPGHGKGRKTYGGLEEILKDLARITWREHDVVGWSLGGSVALLFALRYPQKVRRLILIGTTPHFGGVWGERNVRAMKLKIKKEGIAFFRRLACCEYEDLFLEDVAFKLLDDYVSLNLTKVLPSLSKEAFIIHGIGDPIVPPSEALRLHNLLKGSKLIFLGGGHLPVRDEEHLESALLKSG
ncbi:MAG: alpha/beta hydrolase [Aquificae bacterium]|nr:alpha/beta hydrolase [Aquificota bacterium]